MTARRTDRPRYLGWLLAGASLWLAVRLGRRRRDAYLRRQRVEPIGSYKRPG
jgi:hypothetical protein